MLSRAELLHRRRQLLDLLAAPRPRSVCPRCYGAPGRATAQAQAREPRPSIPRTRPLDVGDV